MRRRRPAGPRPAVCGSCRPHYHNHHQSINTISIPKENRHYYQSINIAIKEMKIITSRHNLITLKGMISLFKE